MKELPRLAFFSELVLQLLTIISALGLYSEKTPHTNLFELLTAQP